MIMPMLSVQNLAKSLAFYRDTLGFRHDITMQNDEGMDDFAIVTLGRDSSFGLSVRRDVEKPGSGVHFIVYVGDDTNIDAYYAEVQQHGAVIEKAIETQFYGDRSFTLFDPDGYSLEIAQTVGEMTEQEMKQNRVIIPGV